MKWCLGEYKCMVENKFGQDQVSHTLIVNGPPEPPMVILTSQTTDSITFKLKTEDEVRILIYSSDSLFIYKILGVVSGEREAA